MHLFLQNLSMCYIFIYLFFYSLVKNLKLGLMKIKKKNGILGKFPTISTAANKENSNYFQNYLPVY